MTQDARVLIFANGGSTNKRASWNDSPAASWGSATTQNLPTFQNATSSTWIRAAYSPSLNIVVAIASGSQNNRNQVATSGDGGVNWVGRNIPASYTLTDICWAPGLGLFVISASAGPTTTARILTSPDGITWTTRSLPDASKTLNAICCGTISAADFLVAVGASNVIYTSTDGINWTAQSGPGASRTWTGITWASGQSKFVAVATGGAGVSDEMDSTTGTSWTQRSTGGSYSWTQIGYSVDLDQCIAIGGNTGVILYSAAGGTTSWTQSTTGLGGNAFTDVAWSHDYTTWVLVSGGGGSIYTCATCNGSWTSQTPPNSNNWATVVAIPSASAPGYNLGIDYPYSNGNVIGSSGNDNSTAAGCTITTTQTNELLILSIYNERLQGAGAYATCAGPTSAGLTWTLFTRHQWRGGRNGSSPYNYNNHEIWYAQASAIQSAVGVTATLSANSDNSYTCAVGVIGADPTTPFDANSSLPAVADGGTSQSVSNEVITGVSTTGTDPLVFFIVAAPRALTSGAAPASFTMLQDNGYQIGTDWAWQIVSVEQPGAALSNATITGTTPQIANWGTMAFAISPPISGATGTIVQTLGLISQSATTNEVTGTVVQSLELVSQSASGEQWVSGVAAQTLELVTQSMAGTEQFTGTIEQTLGLISQFADSNQVTSGSIRQTLSLVTQEADGEQWTQGDIIQIVGRVSQSVAGAEWAHGTVAQIFRTVSQEIDGAMSIPGSGLLTQHLALISQTADGEVTNVRRRRILIIC